MEKITKICTKCNCKKELIEFVKDKNKKDGTRSICKLCVSEYRKLNKDKINRYYSQYRANNKEKIKESQSKYSSKIENKTEKKRREKKEVRERINEKSRILYKSDKSREKRLKYYEDNRYSILKKQKERMNNNLENFKDIQRKYRQSEKGKIAEKNKYHKRRFNYKNGNVTNDQLRDLYKKTKKCYWCNCKLEKVNTHLDHYVPLSKGGNHDINNLVLSCSKCNLKKSNKDPLLFANELGKLL